MAKTHGLYRIGKNKDRRRRIILGKTLKVSSEALIQVRLSRDDRPVTWFVLMWNPEGREHIQRPCFASVRNPSKAIVTLWVTVGSCGICPCRKNSVHLQLESMGSIPVTFPSCGVSG